MKFLVVTFVFIFPALTGRVLAQDSLRVREGLRVVARVSTDSISLRWAPSDFSTWKTGNVSGYQVERYTVVKNGIVLNVPERLILTPRPLKPQPEQAWESLVRKDKYAAVAAQALFGAAFEMDFSQNDVFQIVNKVKENEQRFAFALFCADMSLSVSMASGLFIADHQAKSGEKYLYRVSIIQSADTVRGSIYTGLDEIYTIPKPNGLSVMVQDTRAILQWNHSPFPIYTAYSIERSSEGKNFSVISDEPLVTVSPRSGEAGYEVYTDSLPVINGTFFYRVRGITPFGERSEPSEIVSGTRHVSLDQYPVIVESENFNNQSILIHWEFPVESNLAISGFTIERSPNPKAGFKRLTTEFINGDVRNYRDDHPAAVNYYKVGAQGKDGRLYSSSIHLVQLIDSIPPVAPTRLKATVDDDGHVLLSWSPNPEPDVYGYRIYRSNYDQEELFQITDGPIANVTYVDTINLNTLSTKIYYSVMALDKRQNHSVLSDKLEITLPDKVKPQPPVFLSVRNEPLGVTMEWEPSSSGDVIRYHVYRKGFRESTWLRIHAIEASDDSIYHFTDTTDTYRRAGSYVLVSIDKSGLESAPSRPISGTAATGLPLPKMQWDKPMIRRDKSEIELTWGSTRPGVDTYRIYRAKGTEEIRLYKTISSRETKFADASLTPGVQYRYQIMAMFEDGRKSILSESIVIDY
jgi:uncharacterized protein